MHQPSRRRLLAALALLGMGGARAQPGAGPDAGGPVRVYLVPLDDFPEYLASNLATLMQAELGIRVASSMRLPPLDIPLLGGGQYAAEALMERAVQASAKLPGLLPSTYRVFLTLHDINAASGSFRFQFSMHSPGLNCSVVSMARLLEGDAPTEKAIWRMVKMVKRAIGELHLGWRRSTHRRDLMYAPLMNVADVDRLGSEHELVTGEGERPTFERLLEDVRDTVAAYAPRAWALGPALVFVFMLRVADGPNAALVGEWIVAKPRGLVRALAAGALPVVAVAALALVTDLGAPPWWGWAALAGAAAASAWLLAEVFGTTLRFNEDAVELRRPWRRPRSVPLAGAVLEPDENGRRFTVRGAGGEAIVLRVGYRPGTVLLVNYLTRKDGRGPAFGFGGNDGDEDGDDDEDGDKLRSLPAHGVQ